MKLSLLLLALPLLASAGTPTVNLRAAAAKAPKAPVQPVEPIVDEVPSRWTLSAGVQWRQIGDSSFVSPSRGSALISSGLGGPSTSSTGYTNGYVDVDSTGGANTWNWGFDDASQLNGSTLSLNGVTTATGGGALADSTSSSDDLQGLGAFFQVESPVLAKWKRFQFSVVAGYSFTQSDMDQSSTQQLAVRQTRFVDQFDISTALPLAGATNQGDFAGPGPVISRTPMSRTEEVMQDELYTNTLRQSLDVQLHTLSIGPRVGMEFKRLRAIASAGLAVNLTNWNATVNETLVGSNGGPLGQWRDHASDTEVLLGAYAELGLQWRLSPRWIVTASGRYDWSEALEGSVGESEFSVDLGGWTAMLGLGWQF